MQLLTILSSQDVYSKKSVICSSETLFFLYFMTTLHGWYPQIFMDGECVRLILTVRSEGLVNDEQMSEPRL